MVLKSNLSLALKICMVLGAFLCLTGILFIAAPEIGGRVFGIIGWGETPDTSLVWATGIRQLSLGLIIILLAWLRQVKALAVTLLVGSLVPLMDTIIVMKSVGVVDSLRHAATVPVVMTFGVYLLRASERVSTSDKA